MNDHGRNHAGTAHDERVSALLSAAAAPSEPGPLPGEGAALAAYRTSLTPTRRRSMITSFLRARTGLAAAVGAGVLLTGGVTTAAAAGGLPAAAQDTAHNVLGTFGFEVPPAVAANGNADTRDKSDATLADEPAGSADDDVAATDDDGATDTAPVTGDADPADRSAGESSGKGEEISGLATSMEGGPEKGAAISAVASEGKSKAGLNRQDEESEESDDHGRPEGAGSASEAGQDKAEAAKAESGDSDESDSEDEDETDSEDETDDDADERRADGARD